MLVRYRGSASDDNLIKEYLNTLFQELMAETPSKLLVGNVMDLSYLGDKTTFYTPETSTIDLNDFNVLQPQVLDSNNNMMLSALISASTVVLLASVLLILRVRQRRKDSTARTEKDSPVDLDKLDLEAGGTDTSDRSTGVPKTGSDLTIGISTSYDSKLGIILADTGADNVTNQVIPGATSHDSTEFTGAAAAGVPALPPRPPRRNSQKLKKRRKRKKKKKKTTLKRVNSRENVQAMEAIPESEDEGSEFGSECDSEYTWSDDDGSSNHSSSGCSTPVRSRSLPDSRASSPKLSPQDELFSSDVFSTDFDFVIEAPDFPFGTKGEESKRSKSREERLKPRTSRLKDVVSPIKEEKIRPIPPPWI
jgi:hypothetical protein